MITLHQWKGAQTQSRFLRDSPYIAPNRRVTITLLNASSPVPTDLLAPEISVPAIFVGPYWAWHTKRGEAEGHPNPLLLSASRQMILWLQA